MKNELEETSENSHLQPLLSSFRTKTVVTQERLSAAFRKFREFVYIFRSYSRTKLEKTSENSYLQPFFSPFLTKTVVTQEQLGAAFRKFINIFSSYNITLFISFM